MLSCLKVGFAVVCLLGPAFCGCVTSMRVPSDNELIGETLDRWKAALEAQDLDALMAVFSERFAASAASSKAELRESLGQALEEGRFEDPMVDLQGVQLTTEGDTVSVGPVALTCVLGTVRITFRMAKEEDNCWRIIALE